MFYEKYWLPIEQELDVEFSIPLTLKGKMKRVLRCFDYKVNKELPDNIFNVEKLTFSPGFNEKDSLFWEIHPQFSLTKREREEIKNLPSGYVIPCLLYTSPSPRDLSTSRMPSSA